MNWLPQMDSNHHKTSVNSRPLCQLSYGGSRRQVSHKVLRGSDAA